MNKAKNLKNILKFKNEPRQNSLVPNSDGTLN